MTDEQRVNTVKLNEHIQATKKEIIRLWEEREDNDKREAKAATGDNRFDPGANAVRGKAGQKFGEPTWDELRGLSADERRAMLARYGADYLLVDKVRP